MKAAGAPRVAVAPRDGSLAVSVVRFCRLLKRWGLRLPAGSAQIALAALTSIDITRRFDFRNALKIALLTRPEDFQLFDYLFNAFWSLDAGKPAASPPASATSQADAAAAEDAPDAEGSDEAVEFEGVRTVADGAAAVPEGAPLFLQAARFGSAEPPAQMGATPDAAALERVARALAAQLRNRRSRRYELHPRGHLWDLRRTLRRSLRYGGVPIELGWRRPRIARSELLLFCDVSRSMREYTQLFLRFAAAVLRAGWQVEVFLFASELRRVTDSWRDKRWSEIEGMIPGCGGGTQWGASLATFFRDYEHSLAGPRTTVIILSDGLDAGEPQLITETMSRLQRQTRRVVWLNPLLRLEGYAPTARGMAAALPYVEVFAPAHDLESLWALVGLLAGHRHSV